MDKFLEEDVVRGKEVYWRGFRMGALAIGGTMAWLGAIVIYLLK